MTRIVIVLSAVLLPATALAHPDHGLSGSADLLHFLADPYHLGVAVASMLICLALGRSIARRLSTGRARR